MSANSAADWLGNYDATLTLPELLDRRALSVPDAPAVVSHQATLTYRQLREVVNSLAGRLERAGVTLEDRVAIMLPHSAEMLVAMLAVMRSGAAYVPLDGSSPNSYNESLMSDAGVKVAVADPRHADLVCKRCVLMFCLTRDSTGSYSGQNQAGPDNLSCVIYTSGSTGRPKGVMIQHRGLSNLMVAAADRFGLVPGDRMLSVASGSFSASLEELFPPIMSGASVVFAPDRLTLASPEALVGVVEDYAVTVLEIQTAYWYKLLRHLTVTRAALPRTLRLLIVGGERMQPEAVARWHEVGADVSLVHVYGPTETTATATYDRIDVQDVQRLGEVPIGYPIGRTRLYVVDAGIRRVPRGEPGELCIAGESLSRGYLGMPAATAEAFVPDPFAGGGSLMYRTGDRVRELSDGRITFLGRMDDQVKVNGYRVEPRQIEAALEANADINEALVCVKEDSAGERHLVAYVVPVLRNVDIKQARRHIAGMLPRHMIPAAVLEVPELPLTKYGKVDRAELPNPFERRTPDADGATSSSDTESSFPSVVDALCTIWKKLLVLDDLSPEDDLRALGVDSLLTVRFIAELEAGLGVRLTPTQAFAARTAAELTPTVSRALAEK